MSKKKSLDMASLAAAYNWALFLAGDETSGFKGEKTTFGTATQSLYSAVKKSGYAGNMYTRTAREPRFRAIARDLFVAAVREGHNLKTGRDFSGDEMRHAPQLGEGKFAFPEGKEAAFREAAESLLDGLAKRGEAHFTHSQVEYAARKHSLPVGELSRFLGHEWGLGVAPKGAGGHKAEATQQPEG
jgi:hypothetical protein